MSLFDFIKSFYGEEVNMYHKSYEDKLYKKYGKCENIKEDITLLIIADTHGTLNEEKFLEFINQNTKYDACIMLGDHYDRDISIILKYVDKNKLYGILGNHDYNYLDN